MALDIGYEDGAEDSIVTRSEEAQSSTYSLQFACATQNDNIQHKLA